MPGYRGRDERSEQIIIRVTPVQKAKWASYVEAHGGYLSGLIRRAVEDFIHEHPGAKPRLNFYDS